MKTKNINHAIEVKICGITDASELRMLDLIGADYAGIWFNVPDGKYNLNLERFTKLARTPVSQLECIGVTTERSPSIINEFVQASGIAGVQLHGFLLPSEITAIRRRLDERVMLLKVLHIQNGRCLEMSLLKQFEQCGADAFILDNFISRECAGSTGQRIPLETVETLVDILGAERVFLAGGLAAQDILQLRQIMPVRGVDIDTGARDRTIIDSRLVQEIVSAAGANLQPVVKPALAQAG